ncbi:MAG: LysR family transcriptional regulator [Burkholderiaceae bacterium]
MNPSSTTIFRRFTTKAKFRHMLVLLKLRELGSMKRAAEAIGLTQPAVSLMLGELEKLLGAPLFLRHARGVEATQVALDLLPVARRVIAALEDGSEIVANAVADNEGYVRVAATPAAMGSLLHPFLPGYARRYTRVHVEVREVSAGDPLDLITWDACDILCLRQPAVIPEGWQFRQCRADRLVVLCAVDHPLAAADQASLEILGRQHWLLARTASVAREHFEAIAAQANWPVANRCGIVTHTPALTLELMRKGAYLTLIPQSVAQPWIEAGLVRPIESDASLALPPLGLLHKVEYPNRAVAVFAQALAAS